MEYQKASLFIIGTELTCGVIADKHTVFLAGELTRLGYKVVESVVVPDDADITAIFTSAAEKSDVVLVTGGLGPTADDMTRYVIAKAAGVELERNEEAWKALYARIGERAYGANEKQADIPAGFEVLPNPNGTAPGFMGYLKDGVFCAAMPGPPREMNPMFANYVLPALAKLRGHANAMRDEYSLFLIPEARLEEFCLRAAAGNKDIVYGDRFQDFRISLYLSGSTESERSRMVSELSAMMGEGLLRKGNFEAADIFISKLKEKHASVAVAESVTGGLVSKLLTDRIGASAWYKCGLTTYATEAKHGILSVDDKILSTAGPVSKECAVAMAEGVLKASGADFALSTTGYAGPEGENVGLVWFGFAGKGRKSEAVSITVPVPGRDSIRRRASTALFILGEKYLEGRAVIDIVKSWQYI